MAEQHTDMSAEQRQQALDAFAHSHGKQVNELSDAEMKQAAGAGLVSDIEGGAGIGAALGAPEGGIGAGPGAVLGGLAGGTAGLLAGD